MLKWICTLILFIMTGNVFSQQATDQSDIYIQQVNKTTNTVNGEYNETAENPFSSAIGERIVGFILLGTAVVNFALAVPVGQSMESTYDDGDIWTSLIITEGCIRGLVGGIFVGIGYSKYAKYKKWEKENGLRIDMSINQVKLTYNF